MSRRDAPHPYIPHLVEQLKTGEISRREFLRTATLLGMTAAAAYGIAGGEAVTMLSTPAHAQGTAGGTLRIAHRVPDISSPQRLGWFRFLNLTIPVVQTLTFTGHDNVTRPLLAASWEASPDLKTWTFNLQPNARWHDGRPFVADDVIWNLRRLLDPATGSSILGLMEPYLLNVEMKDGKKTTALWSLNAIEKLDDKRVRLNLKSPQLAVPELFFHHTSVMMDPRGEGKFGVGAVGTGPFQLVELTVGKKAVFKALKDHWGTPPKIDAVEFIDLGDDTTAIFGALAAKQVDGIFDFDFVQMDAYKSLNHVSIYSAPTATCGTLNMVLRQKPFDDARVRLAIKYAIDQRKLMDIAIRGNGAEANHHHVAPVHPDFAPMPPFKRDVAKAKALMAEAGHASGFDSDVYVMAESPWHAATIQAMVEQLKEINVRLTIKVLPSSQFWNALLTLPLSFSDWAHRPLGTQMLALCYRTGVRWNICGWSNPEFDKLLNQAEGILDPVARRTVMAKLQEILQQDGPVALPFWVNMATAYDKKVQGFRMHPSGIIVLHELSLAA